MSKPASRKPRAVKRAHPLVHWFDALFIMALCFLTLLSTMLLRGKVLVGGGEASGLDYTVGIGSCISVIAVFIAYLWYMLVHSERELKDMVNHLYGEKKTGASLPESSDNEEGDE